MFTLETSIGLVRKLDDMSQTSTLPSPTLGMLGNSTP